MFMCMIHSRCINAKRQQQTNTISVQKRRNVDVYSAYPQSTHFISWLCLPFFSFLGKNTNFLYVIRENQINFNWTCLCLPYFFCYQFFYVLIFFFSFFCIRSKFFSCREWESVEVGLGSADVWELKVISVKI